MLASVADDGQEDDPDEVLADAQVLHDALQRGHEGLGGEGHDERRQEHHRDGHGDGERGLLVFVVPVVVLGHGLPVRDELEEEEGAVGGHADAGAYARKRHDVLLVAHADKDSGQRKADGGQEEHRHVAHDAVRVVPLLLLRHQVHRGGPAARAEDAAEEEGHAEDEQHVGEHGAEERGLHDLREVGLQRVDSDDHLHRVAEGRVEQAADGVVAQGGREFLRGVAQDLGQRDHGREVQPEGPRGVPA
mmetsp:Transcript_63142/g.195907  ORF Transcript_63142/g.195907 Transcript_63142/m.195907 type:complete len:247 (-) Transcript_63142:421-1161(-)